MGTLIIGGLLVIALLAIVGSIFAARGGTTSEARRTPAKAPAPKVADRETRVETPPVATPAQPEESVGQPLSPTPGAVNNGQTHAETLVPTTPLADNKGQAYDEPLAPATPLPDNNRRAYDEPLIPATPSADNDGQAYDEPFTSIKPSPARQPSYNANGQIHELTAQLQALHEEARYLSQRLSQLTEMAEHIEGRQGTHSEDDM